MVRIVQLWIFLVGGCFVHAIDPLNLWLKRSPRPEHNNLLAIAQGNGMYIAAGEKGVILASTNGIQWNLVHGETDMELRKAAFGNGVFVVGGWGDSYYQTNIALVSSNGTEWVPRSLDAIGDFMGLAFAANRFVINTGEGRAPWTSINGWDWTRGTVAIDHDTEDIAGGGGLFVVADYQDVGRSPNGTDWEFQAAPFNGIAHVNFVNARFVVIGDPEPAGSTATNFATSTDGVNWAPRTFPLPAGAPGGDATAVGYIDGRYVVLGSVANRPAAWIAVNEQSWQIVENLSFSKAPADLLSEPGRLIAVGAKGEIGISSNGLSWNKVHEFGAQHAWSISFCGDRYIGAGLAGAIATSLDGRDWNTQVVGGTNQAWFGIAHRPGRTVVVGRYGGIAVSTDGAAWVKQSLAGYADLMAVAEGDGQFVAVGNGFFANSHRIVVSSNGMAWNTVLTGTGFSLYGIVHANGFFTAVGNGGKTLTSSNGTEWSEQPGDPLVTFRSVAFGSGRYVAVGSKRADDGTYSIPAVMWSTNSIDWQSGAIVATNATRFELHGVSFGDGVFVATAARAPVLGSRGGMLFSSTDGQSWTQRFTLPVGAESHDFTGVAYGPGSFVAVGPTGVIYQTPDVRGILRMDPRIDGDAGYRMMLSGVTNGLYAIERSTNLVTWDRRWTNRVDNAEVEVFNMSTFAPMAFYRAVFLRE